MEVKFSSIDEIDIIEMYKEKLKGTRKTFIRGIWQRPDAVSNAIKVTRYLIEEVLKLSDEELKEKLSSKFFYENSLGGMLEYLFDRSPYKVINTVYPNRFREWEFKQVPNRFWSREKGIEATRWLVEEKLKLSDEELKEELSRKLFIDNGLVGMLQICFNNSPYQAISTSYPNKFKEWEFKKAPRNFWTKEKGIEAIRWLVEEKLKLSDEELKEKLSQKVFKDNGLWDMLKSLFNASPFQAINTAYPNKFKEWEFKMTPINFWTKEKGVEATRWLVEEKLKLSDEELKEKLSLKLFKVNGLWGMLHICFNGSYKRALQEAYPNRFK